MKHMPSVIFLSLLLVESLPVRILNAEDLFVQKSGYMKEVGAMQETMEFSGHKSTQYRDVIDIPEGFGKLLTITPGGDGVVFWFQNDQGYIRNVSIPIGNPIIIQRKGMITVEQGLNG